MFFAVSTSVFLVSNGWSVSSRSERNWRICCWNHNSECHFTIWLSNFNKSRSSYLRLRFFSQRLVNRRESFVSFAISEWDCSRMRRQTRILNGSAKNIQTANVIPENFQNDCEHEHATQTSNGKSFKIFDYLTNFLNDIFKYNRPI